MFNHFFRLTRSLIREHISKRTIRSKEWPNVRKQYLLSQPVCETCGKVKHLQVHHIEPFHIDPSKELDPDNLLTLCMGDEECHLRIGHGSDFKAFNPHVELDAKLLTHNPSLREEIEKKAEMSRRY